MKRRFRLTGSADFQRLRRFGKAIHHPLMVMVLLPNESQASRIGVVAGRVVGKAVERNRAKRLIRHALQPYIESIPSGWNILLIARRPILSSSFLKIQESLRILLCQSGLMPDLYENDRPA